MAWFSRDEVVGQRDFRAVRNDGGRRAFFSGAHGGSENQNAQNERGEDCFFHGWRNGYETAEIRNRKPRAKSTVPRSTRSWERMRIFLECVSGKWREVHALRTGALLCSDFTWEAY